MDKAVKEDWLSLKKDKFCLVWGDSGADEYERGIMSFTDVFEHVPTGTFWQLITKTVTSDGYYGYSPWKTFEEVATCEHQATKEKNFEDFLNNGRIKEVFRKTRTQIYYE